MQLLLPFLFGAIIGSFLNVVAYRFNTGKSLNGSSHCLSCGVRLRFFELVPVFSYLAQKGRCRHCKSHVPSHYAIVELVTGALFVGIWLAFSNDLVLAALNLVFASVLVVVFVYDLRHLVIPDRLVLLLLGIALVYVSLEGVSYDALLGALIPASFLGALWLVTRGRALGLGDVKLVVPLGLILGAWGSISLLLFAFWIGAVVSVALLVRGQSRLPFMHGNLTMKSEVPFAPFLILAFFLVHLAGADALALVAALL